MFGGRNKQGRSDNKFGGIVSLLYYLYFTARELQQEQRSDGRQQIPSSCEELGASSPGWTLGQPHPEVLPQLGLWHWAALTGLRSNLGSSQVLQQTSQTPALCLVRRTAPSSLVPLDGPRRAVLSLCLDNSWSMGISPQLSFWWFEGLVFSVK